MRIEDLKAITDPYERAQEACSAIQRANGFIDGALEVRNFAFMELHTKGESIRAIATRYGVSKTLVAGIVG